MENLKKLTFEKIIKLIKSGEEKYLAGDFKGAIDDKRKANLILTSNLIDKEIKKIYKEELSKIYVSKFDLIYDHKKRLDEIERKKIIRFLEQKSQKKYKKGDYKGAIKALRRSEKYN